MVVWLAKCPNCGKEIKKPARILSNHFFILEAYVCDCCHKHFRNQKHITDIET